MATKGKVELAVMTTDMTAFDVDVAGESRNPVALVVVACIATALNTNTNDKSLSFGVTDFTTVGCISFSDEHGRTDQSDSSGAHQETNIVSLLDPGTTTVLRSLTVVAKAGGATFTPVQSGSAYRFEVTFFFGPGVHCFSDDFGGARGVDSTHNIAHLLGIKSNAGIYFMSSFNNAAGSASRISMGFHVDNGTPEQADAAYVDRHFVDPSESAARLNTDRVGSVVGTNGIEAHGMELTGNDATNCTYTNRVATGSGALIGLLFDFDDVSVDMAVVDTPTNADADWDYTGLAFQSQLAIAVMTFHDAINGSETDLKAGTLSYAAFDEDGAEASVNGASEDAVVFGTSNTQSRIDDKLWMGSHSGGSGTFDMDDPTFTATGFSVTNANLVATNGTIRKWPMLFIGKALSGVAPLALNHLNQMQAN